MLKAESKLDLRSKKTAAVCKKTEFDDSLEI
jgi:hypothetical protein